MFQLDPDLEAFRQDIRKTAERAFSAKEIGRAHV